ncbi:MAG TPA: DNA-3-methyladenine glycosylase [Ginsengibacter sp.]|nr:DNA-3-methyladenine glycosylase [Ginsengibacter sp.]HRP18197.1 DNA-3-methyladenine glycosylase [Ginsengibacter sp.]HRP43837.1 DNA-3-methyladenine glycosylase [Ginsengibacter sp.]
MKHKKLPRSFYERTDVLLIAKELLGKVVVTNINDRYTSGRIVETEAYVGLVDKASHSYGGKRTPRNEHMYSPAGTAYIYICYGIHHMLNVVTNKEGKPDAVLIRAVEPLKGIDIMLERTGKTSLDHSLTRGPGNAGKALGIFKHLSGIFLLDNQIYLEDDGFSVHDEDIGISKRIGLEGAGEDAHLPYRFYLKGNPYVSGRKN